METPSVTIPLPQNSIFVRLPVSPNDPRRISCLILNPSIWEPTVRGLKSRLLSLSGHVDTKHSRDLFYVINNGKLVEDDCALEGDREYAVQCRVLGGKGGFGSLLRSFGSQISKNRNQDACRDLSGRRLRNVKAEKRVKEYVEKKAEKDKEKRMKKDEKIQKMKATLQSKPKHNFNDAEYEAERKRIPDKVFSAVEEGIRVMSSSKTAEVSVATASTSKVSESFDGSVEKLTEEVTVLTKLGAPALLLIQPTQTEKKRKHEDPMVNNMGSKRMKGWLGVDDNSDDSEDDAK